MISNISSNIKVSFQQRNIFLHFLNMGIRDVLYFRKYNFEIEESINRGIKVATALTSNFLVYPLSSHFEDTLVRNSFYEEEYRVLIQNCFLRAAIKEVDNYSYLEKKKKQYYSQRNKYPGYYEQNALGQVDFLELCYYKKFEDTGESIRNLWVNSLVSENSDFTWNFVPKENLVNLTNSFLDVSKQISNKNEAFTWHNLTSYLDDDFRYMESVQRILEGFYLQNYLRNYHLDIVINLPYSQNVFKAPQLIYNYEAFIYLLRRLGIQNNFFSLKISEIYNLRLEPIFLLATEYFLDVVAISTITYSPKRLLAELLFEHNLNNESSRSGNSSQNVARILMAFKSFIVYFQKGFGSLALIKESNKIEELNNSIIELSSTLKHEISSLEKGLAESNKSEIAPESEDKQVLEMMLTTIRLSEVKSKLYQALSEFVMNSSQQNKLNENSEVITELKQLMSKLDSISEAREIKRVLTNNQLSEILEKIINKRVKETLPNLKKLLIEI